MHDRVADRAAPNATPGDLAVRDWLLVALSFATGSYEAICFLTFRKVFTCRRHPAGRRPEPGHGGHLSRRIRRRCRAGDADPEGIRRRHIELASGLATRSLTAPSTRRLTATMISLAVGAFLGDWMLGHAHSYAPAVPAFVTVAVIAIAAGRARIVKSSRCVMPVHPPGREVGGTR